MPSSDVQRESSVEGMYIARSCTQSFQSSAPILFGNESSGASGLMT